MSEREKVGVLRQSVLKDLLHSICSVHHSNAKTVATSPGPGGAGDTQDGNKIKGGKLRRRGRASAEDWLGI